jgi:hypothetical protein
MKRLKFFDGLVCLTLILLIAPAGANAQQVWNEDSQTYVNTPLNEAVAKIIGPLQTDETELLWDDIHDADNDDLFGNYSECYSLMTALGINATQISTGVLNSTLLAAYDVLVLIDAELDYTAEEIADIQSWIAAGGKLLMIGENTNAFNWISNNQVLEPYNMQFVSVMIPTTGATNFAAHPITSDLSAISWAYGTMLIINPPAEELAWDNQNQYAITINEAGVVVVVINDSNMMENPYIYDDDNYLCMLNTFNYLASPGGTPEVTIELTYVSGSPVPAGGGDIDFDVTLNNAGTAPGTFDAWIMVQLPNASWYGPVLGPANLTLAASQTISRSRVQNVPAGAPAGFYLYEGRVGVYPDTVWNSDSFTFEKLGPGNGIPVNGWANYGEGFEAWATESEFETPDEFVLFGNYPNPFNPTTVLSYQLSTPGHVELSIYDINGRSVAELVNGWRDTGSHEVTFDATTLASGLYLYRLEAGDFTSVKKMVLMK